MLVLGQGTCWVREQPTQTFVAYSITVKATNDLHVGLRKCAPIVIQLLIWIGQSSGCSSFRSRQPTFSQISRNGSERSLIGHRVSVGTRLPRKSGRGPGKRGNWKSSFVLASEELLRLILSGSAEFRQNILQSNSRASQKFRTFTGIVLQDGGQKMQRLHVAVSKLRW